MLVRAYVHKVLSSQCVMYIRRSYAMLVRAYVHKVLSPQCVWHGTVPGAGLGPKLSHKCTHFDFSYNIFVFKTPSDERALLTI